MKNFFVFEGPDEVGKTTVVTALEAKLLSVGINCIRLSFPGKEPNTLGNHIYDLHHDPALFGIKGISPLALQTLHVAAHADVVERKIVPLLKQGTIVLLDRYWWSTWVYGIVSGIHEKNLQTLINLEKSFWNDFYPTSLFLFNRSVSNSDVNLVHAYNKLALDERGNYPIIKLVNDGTVEEAVNKILPFVLNV